MFLLSFLTITYKRSELIERLYNSIVNSEFKKDLFEWIVIVNGRNENLDTIKKLNTWKLENKININYYIIEVNKGLNRALNSFNNISDSSYYVMRIDDDDILDPIALSMLTNLLIEYKDNTNIGFILNMNDHFKNLIGSELPNDKIPRSNFYYYFIYKCKGDKSRIYPTQVLKKFYYKVYDNESYSPDAQVYYDMDSVLKLIPLNLSPIIREYLPGGLTNNESLLKNNIESILDANMELLNHKEARLKDKILIYFKSYVLVIKTQRYKMINKIKPFGVNWLIFILLYPIAKTYHFFRSIINF